MAEGEHPAPYTPYPSAPYAYMPGSGNYARGGNAYGTGYGYGYGYDAKQDPDATSGNSLLLEALLDPKVIGVIFMRNLLLMVCLLYFVSMYVVYRQVQAETYSSVSALMELGERDISSARERFISDTNILGADAGIASQTPVFTVREFISQHIPDEVVIPLVLADQMHIGVSFETPPSRYSILRLARDVLPESWADHYDPAFAADDPRSKLVLPAFGWGAEFAWGGEQLVVGDFRVPEDTDPVTVLGEVLPDNQYRITTIIVGDPELISDVYELEIVDNAVAIVGDEWIHPLLTLRIDKLVARPGTRFSVRRSLPYWIARTLREQFLLAYDPRVGTLNVSMTQIRADRLDRSVELLEQLLDEMIAHDLRTSAEPVRKLQEWITERIPQVEADISAIELELVNYLASVGTVNVDQSFGRLSQRAQQWNDLQLDTDLSLRQADAEISPLHPRYQRYLKDRELYDELEQEDRASALKWARERTEYQSWNRKLDFAVREYNSLYTTLKNIDLWLATGSTPFTMLRSPAIDYHKTQTEEFGGLFVVLFGLTILASFGFGLLRHAMGFERIKGVFDVTRAAPSVRFLGIAPYSDAEEQLSVQAPSIDTPSILLARFPETSGALALLSLTPTISYSVSLAGTNVIGVTSVTPGEGKSFVCSNLAHILTQSGDEKGVLLIDADTRAGRLHRMFGASKGPGLTGVLSGAIKPEEAIISSTSHKLSILPRGHVSTTDPLTLLGGARLRSLLEWAEDKYKYIVIDTPPTDVAPDANVIAQVSGYMILVMRQSRSRYRDVENSVRSLRMSGGRVDATILNMVKQGRFSRYLELLSGNAGRGTGYMYNYRYPSYQRTLKRTKTKDVPTKT